jgi:hypothetical protein
MLGRIVEKVREKLNYGVVTQFVLACGKSNVFLEGSQAMLARPHDNNNDRMFHAVPYVLPVKVG